MTSLRLTDVATPMPTDGARPGAIVVGTRPADGDAVALVAADVLDTGTRAAVESALRTLRATGKAEEVLRVPLTVDARPADLVAAVGLGAPEESDGESDGAPRWTADVVRRAAGAAVRALAGLDDATVLLGLANGGPADGGPADGHGDVLADCVAAAAEGAAIGAYVFRTFRSPAPDHRGPVARVDVGVPASTSPGDRERLERALARADVGARAVNRARDWVNTPPNALYPETLVRVARELAATHGLEIEVYDEVRLREEGFGGISGVGQGSEHPPRLVRLTWRPPAGSAEPTERATPRIALIGKGITFDSGGLSLKPPPAMKSMKSDMSGAAAVLAATVALAELGVAAEVTAWLALAENMPSGTAQRPGDVIHMYGGKTVEVLNTDAEGRLVLGDAVARASQDSPDRLLVVATLTGAQGIALGSRTCGVMGEPTVRDEVVAASGTTGEAMWPMPLPDDVRRGMDSDVADIANIGDGMGGMLAGGLFLREFVGEGVRWAHLDIARPAYNDKAPWGCTPKGATGVPVRTLIAYVERLAAGR